MSNTKSARVELRVAPADDALLREAARLSGESLSRFLLDSGRERAERLLADRTRFALADREWQKFTEALDRPAEVKVGVADLFSRARPA
jgi:uncharacterized protein (DUF1778 family)